MYQPHQSCNFHQQPSQQQQQKHEFLYDTLLAEAINQIPIHETAEYLVALVKCPLDVRLREADPRVFVEFENGNIWAAAKRLVTYWKWRVHLFGEIIAYESILDIPLNATQPNAQYDGRDDVSRLRAELRQSVDDQAMIILPQKDTQGNFVIFFDLERCNLEMDKNVAAQNFLRLFFYNCTVMINRAHLHYKNVCDNDNVSGVVRHHHVKMNSFVSICVLQRTPNHMEKVIGSGRQVTEYALPFKLIRSHLVLVPQASSLAWKYLIQNVAITVTECTKYFLKHITEIVTQISDRKLDVIKHLLPYGITYENFPTDFGGTCKMRQKFQQDDFQYELTNIEPISFFLSNEEWCSYYSVNDGPVLDTTNNPNLNYNINNTEFSQSQRVFESIILSAMEQLPVIDKIGYQNALQKCSPDIRNSEANPSLFVEYAGGNAFVAAQRLAKYWSWRVLLFGEHLAYQSILQMSRVDDPSTHLSGIWNEFCTLVQSKGITILPEVDVHGNFVMVYDCSRFPLRVNTSNEIDRRKVFQLLLYNITNLVQTVGRCKQNTSLDNREDKTTSLVVLNVVKSFTHTSYKLIEEVCELILEALPARLVRIHNIFVVMDVQTQCTDVKSEMSRCMFEVNALINKGIVVIPHIGIPSEIMQQFTPYGMSSDMISQALGCCAMFQHAIVAVPFNPMPFASGNVLDPHVRDSSKQLALKLNNQPVEAGRSLEIPSEELARSAGGTEALLEETYTSMLPTTPGASQQDYATAGTVTSSNPFQNSTTPQASVHTTTVQTKFAIIDYWKRFIPACGQPQRILAYKRQSSDSTATNDWKTDTEYHCST